MEIIENGLTKITIESFAGTNEERKMKAEINTMLSCEMTYEELLAENKTYHREMERVEERAYFAEELIGNIVELFRRRPEPKKQRKQDLVEMVNQIQYMYENSMVEI